MPRNTILWLVLTIAVGALVIVVVVLIASLPEPGILTIIQRWLS